MDLPGIHECIYGQRPLREVIDIDASSEKIEEGKVNARDMFIRICIKSLIVVGKIFLKDW
jgi:uncharacterized ubiquitin-like protein YukD